MRRLPNVYPADTSTWPNSEGTFDVGAADTGAKILMRNLTPLNLRLDFYNGSTDVLSAWEHNVWPLDGDSPTIGWTIDPDSPSVIAPPSNVVYLTLFNSTEKVPGTYPVFSVLQTSSGSSAGTGGSTNQLINTGNPAGQNVITVNSTGAAGSTVTLSTDGLFQLLVTIAGALVNAIKTQEVEPVLQLGALTHLVEVLGNLQIDGTSILSGALSVNAASTLGDTTNKQGATVNGTLTAQNALNVNGTTAGITNAGPFTTGAIGKLLHNLGDLTVDGTSTFTGAATFSAEPLLSTGKIADGSGNNLIDASTGGMVARGQRSNHNRFTYQGDGVDVDWFINSIGPSVTGSASATVNHLMKEFGVATAPNHFIMNPSTAGGSQTFGFNTITATQVNVVLGATNAYSFKACLL